MAITWDQVEALDSNLSGVSVEAQDSILAYVNSILDVDVFDGASGPMTTLAEIYLAAHHGTIVVRGDERAGPVVSESVGGLSRTYAVFSPAGSDPLLDTTPWGKAFRALVRQSAARGGMVL